MLAADSYEQHVFSLVQNKRDLFDNVVKSDAQEDVVGVSKRMLETIIEDLAGKPASESKEQLKPEKIEQAGKEISEEKTEAIRWSRTAGFQGISRLIRTLAD